MKSDKPALGGLLRSMDTAILVVRDGGVLLRKGYGYADAEEQTPADPDLTLFRPGSVSRLVAWTAVMQMVEHC
ncbi:MAG: serine hydrolase domain-containing protein [Woeseia sp.]